MGGSLSSFEYSHIDAIIAASLRHAIYWCHCWYITLLMASLMPPLCRLLAFIISLILLISRRCLRRYCFIHAIYASLRLIIAMPDYRHCCIRHYYITPDGDADASHFNIIRCRLIIIAVISFTGYYYLFAATLLNINIDGIGSLAGHWLLTIDIDYFIGHFMSLLANSWLTPSDYCHCFTFTSFSYYDITPLYTLLNIFIFILLMPLHYYYYCHLHYIFININIVWLILLHIIN